MSRFRDLTDQRFGRLVAKMEIPGTRGPRMKTQWECVCDCGTVKAIQSGNLTSGHTRSCGCLRNDTAPSLSHGKRDTSEYYTWCSMIQRCENPNNHAFHRYGGRGIKVCSRWRNSFADFLSDVGQRPTPDHSLDRYPDNNGDYEPGNFRWATAVEQANNRRPPSAVPSLHRGTA